ncbi:MAG: hypothetical protein ABSE22_17445 [Xanthobacteraceae bacterium]|jgi:hypothetical protein
MILEFGRIIEAGNYEKERVVIRVPSDEDLGFYAVFQCKADDDAVPYAGNTEHVYWFPSRSLKGGDLVILYSKNGTAGEKKNDSGSTSYFFYWGLPEPVWTTGKLPVLVNTTEWDAGRRIK